MRGKYMKYMIRYNSLLTGEDDDNAMHLIHYFPTLDRRQRITRLYFFFSILLYHSYEKDDRTDHFTHTIKRLFYIFSPPGIVWRNYWRVNSP